MFLECKDFPSHDYETHNGVKVVWVKCLVKVIFNEKEHVQKTKRTVI